MSKDLSFSKLSTPSKGLLTAGILSLTFSCSSRKHQAHHFEEAPAGGSVSYLQKRAVEETSKRTASVKKDTGSREKRNDSKASNISARDLHLDLARISKNLGVPLSRLPEQSRILAHFLSTGKSPQGLCSDEEDNEMHEHLCTLIDEFKNTKRRGVYSSSSQRRVPIRPHHFRIQQSFGYNRLMKSIASEPAARILAWAPKILAQTSCPRNLSAVAIRKLESILPNSQAQNMMERLYQHASACLQPDDEGYEITHFRQALLRKMWGNNTGAKFSINRAVLANESSEKSRVLYWAGLLQESPQKKKAYWDLLVKDYPLSYHALEVWKEEKQDPLQLFASRPDIQLNSRNQNPDESVSQAIAWVEALYAINQETAANKLNTWLLSNYKNELTPPNKLYLTMLKAQGNDNAIHSITRQVANNPDILNEQTLKLLFPRPYFDVFDRACEKTDTNLVLAVARQESGFNPLARSPANARGLLQLLPSTARMLTNERHPNLYNEETNATLGVKFLSRLIERFGSVEHALIAYNAGPGRVDEWRNRFPKANGSILFLDLIPFNETRNYVSSILRNNYWYDRLYKGREYDRPGRDQKSKLVSLLIKNHLAAAHTKGAEETQNF